MTTLERLEARSGRAYRHTTRDYDAARAKVLADPRALTPLDLAILDHFGGADEAAQARAAQTTAETAAAEALAAARARQDALTATPVTVGVLVDVLKGGVLKPLKRRIRALEQTVADLEQRLAAKDPAP